jgi:hypothetical protein
MLRKLIAFITAHRHYWGVPYCDAGRMVMTCYSCGKTRPIKADLTPEAK